MKLEGLEIVLALAFVGVTFGFWKIGELIVLTFRHLSHSWA